MLKVNLKVWLKIRYKKNKKTRTKIKKPTRIFTLSTTIIIMNKLN